MALRGVYCFTGSKNDPVYNMQIQMSIAISIQCTSICEQVLMNLKVNAVCSYSDYIGTKVELNDRKIEGQRQLQINS